MRNLDIQVLDTPETKRELVDRYLAPGYKLNRVSFVVPPQIQGQINAIHSCLTALAGDLSDERKALVVMAGSFLEGLENDLKHYRIEAQDLYL
jgi:hypothetical protein